MIKETRRRKWRSFGDKSSVCKIDLLCSDNLKHSQSLIYCRSELIIFPPDFLTDGFTNSRASLRMFQSQKRK
jgi:hypothetical protein